MSLFNLLLCLETDLFSLCCSWWMLATCCERFPAMKVPTTSLHRLFQHSFISGNFPVSTLTLPCCHLSPSFVVLQTTDAGCTRFPSTFTAPFTYWRSSPEPSQTVRRCCRPSSAHDIPPWVCCVAGHSPSWICSADFPAELLSLPQ